MEIFGMGPAEMLLIVVIALIVFGPGKLPEIAAAIGRAIGDFRRASRDLTSDLQGSIAETRNTLEGAMNETQAGLKSATDTLQQEAKGLSSEISAPPAASAAPPSGAASASSPAPAGEPAASEADANWLRLGSAIEDNGATKG